MQFTSGVAVSAATAVVTALTAAYLFRRKRAPGRRSLVAFNLAVAVWTGGNAFQLAATTLPGKLFWVNVQYVGIALLPASIFAFAVHLSGAENRVTPVRFGLLTAPLAVLVLLSWTNGFHGLVRTSVGLSTVGGVVTIERTFGPAFWLGWVYSNLLNLVATVLVLRAVVYADRIVERRVLALLIGPIVPWLAQFLSLTGAISVEPEVFFSITGVAFAYALVTWDTIEPTPGRDAVLELLDEGVVVVAEDGRVVDLNGAARELLGLGDAPAVGEPVADVFGAHPELLERYRAGESATDVTVETDGTVRHLDLSFSGFDRGVGRPDRIVVLTDVSGIREQERALERQNERLESFASIVSHDLRNPLNVAHGRVDLARNEADSEHLAIAQRAHERMEVLIGDVLTLAREGETVEEAEPVSLREVAESSWQLADTGGATLQVETDQVVRADPSRLQQLLGNLFRNSAEHGATGSPSDSDDEVAHGEGAVTVTVGRAPDGFYVADDGVGIDDADRERVFEAGYTTGEGGSGLGLNIAKELAEAHGWSIEVSRADGGGARFDVTGVEVLPAGEPRAP